MLTCFLKRCFLPDVFYICNKFNLVVVYPARAYLTNTERPLPNARVGIEGENEVVTVTDNGVGIPESQIDSVFEPFYTTMKNSMGLCLIHAKQVIESHKESIAIEGKEEVGIKVTIKIPLF